MRITMALLYNRIEQDGTKRAETNTVAKLCDLVQKSLRCSNLHDRIVANITMHAFMTRLLCLPFEGKSGTRSNARNAQKIIAQNCIPETLRV